MECREFESRIPAYVNGEMDMEEIKIFLREFFPPCQMDPDELSLLSGEFQRGHNMTNENGA